MDSELHINYGVCSIQTAYNYEKSKELNQPLSHSIERFVLTLLQCILN